MSSCILHESLTIWISLGVFFSSWICIQSPYTFSFTTWKTFILSQKLWGKIQLKIKCRNNRKAHMKHREVPKLWNNFVIYNYWHVVVACLVVYQTIWWPHLYTKIEDINFPQTRGKYTIQICSIFTYAFFPESLGHSDPSCHFDIDKKTPTVCIVEVYKQQEVL